MYEVWRAFKPREIGKNFELGEETDCMVVDVAVVSATMRSGIHIGGDGVDPDCGVARIMSRPRAMKSVSAIVLTHNQRPLTERCVRSLLVTPGLAEILFVDNGSQDGTQEYLEAIAVANPSCRLIANTHNLGGSSGRNLGARAAKGDLLLFFDNDAYSPTVPWLSVMRSRLEADSSAGAVTPMLVYPPDGCIIQSGGGGSTEGGHVGLLGRGQPSNEPAFNEPKELSWGPTSCMLCQRGAFEEVGGFDESFDPVSVGEDVDLCFKMRGRGYTILYEPRARVFHYEGMTFDRTEDIASRKRAAFVRNMRVIRSRHREVLQRGPHVELHEIRHMLVRKDYGRLDAPTVTSVPDAEDSFADPYIDRRTDPGSAHVEKPG